MAEDISLQTLGTYAIVIVVAVVTLGIGTQIVGFYQTNQGVGTSSAFETNGSFTGLNSTAVDFAPAALDYWSGGEQRLVDCSDVAIVNASNRAVMTNFFTISGCEATLTNATHNNTVYEANFTYSYKTYNFAYNISGNGTSSLASLAGWMPTFAIILAAVLVLGMLGYLYVRNR